MDGLFVDRRCGTPRGMSGCHLIAEGAAGAAGGMSEDGTTGKKLHATCIAGSKAPRARGGQGMAHAVPILHLGDANDAAEELRVLRMPVTGTSHKG